jgi:hypothetical protein
MGRPPRSRGLAAPRPRPLGPPGVPLPRLDRAPVGPDRKVVDVATVDRAPASSRSTGDRPSTGGPGPDGQATTGGSPSDRRWRPAWAGTVPGRTADAAPVAGGPSRRCHGPDPTRSGLRRSAVAGPPVRGPDAAPTRSRPRFGAADPAVVDGPPSGMARKVIGHGASGAPVDRGSVRRGTAPARTEERGARSGGVGSGEW